MEKMNQYNCWYCNTDKGEMFFSGEFDAYVHPECIMKALLIDSNDDEARIIAQEYIDAGFMGA